MRFLVVLLYAAFVLAPVSALAKAPFSVALYYAPNPPLDELQAFDVVVVEPDAVGITPQGYRSKHSELYAYVSVGEADPARSHFAKLKPAWLIGDNPAWKSKVVDLADPAWRAFFLDQVVEPLWAAGYRGFFLDTLDSYQLVQDKQRHPALQAGLVEVIRSIKQRYPEARLILNRGFEILDQVKELAFAVAAESLFQNFDPTTGAYGEVKEEDRQWLLGKFEAVRKAGLPIIAIDYAPPKDRELARRTADKIKSLGFIPWVTDKDLASLGVGTVEVLPRKILGLYDGKTVKDPANSDLLLYIATPLNYLGYQLELYDINKALPSQVLSGRYAGVIAWPHSETVGVQNNFNVWLQRHSADGVKILFIDGFGMPPEQISRVLGLDYQRPARRPAHPLAITHRTQDIGFETEPSLQTSSFVRLQIKNGEPLLTLAAQSGEMFDAVGITPWGGYIQYPYGMKQIMQNQARWIVNPFTLLSRALRLEQPVMPDTTTENGVRLLLAHIDADGFESYAEWPGGRYAGVEMREKILKRYKIPTAVSVITGIVDEKGLYPAQAAELQKEFREALALPWIEAATHTYSHPYYWQDSAEGRKMYSERYLNIPGYTLDYEAEVIGSAHFINNRLLPPGKKVTLLQWSGDCTPPAEAIRLTYAAGIGNINSGDTVMTASNPSLTAVAPLGVAKGGWFQVFAPNQNENVYTNDWRGPFYGYRRVIETFKMTDVPRRLKPVNIYYHFYSASKLASLQSLLDVYNWAMQQELHPIYTSAYVDKVLDFNRTVVARSGKGWLIRNRGELRQLRLPISAGYPDLVASSNVLGFSEHNDQRYIHLGPDGEAYLQLSPAPPAIPWLASLPARIEQFKRTAGGMELTLTAHLDGTIRFGNASGCNLLSRGKPVPVTRKGTLLAASLSAGTHDIALVCR